MYISNIYKYHIIYTHYIHIYKILSYIYIYYRHTLYADLSSPPFKTARGSAVAAPSRRLGKRADAGHCDCQPRKECCL